MVGGTWVLDADKVAASAAKGQSGNVMRFLHTFS